MAQIEVNENSSDVIAVPVEEEAPKGIAHEMGVTAGIVASGQDRDAVEAYDKATVSGDIDQIGIDSRVRVEDDRKQLIEDLLPVSTTESVQEDAVQLVGDMAGDNGILGPYVQQIKSMPSSIGKSDQDIKELALMTLTREALGAFQSSGVGDTISDIGGILIPKRKAEAVVDVAVRMGFIDSYSDKARVFFDPTGELNRLKNLGDSLEDPIEKALYIKNILEALSQSSDNNLVKAEIADKIFGAGTTALDPLFEQLDNVFAGQLSKGSYNLVKNLSRRASAFVTLEKVNDPEAIAKIIAEARVDPRIKARLGISDADIGKQLDPLDGAPSTFKAQVVHMMDLQDARINAALNNLQREGVLDQSTMEEVMRAAEIAQGKISGVVDAKVISFDETGFKLQWADELFTEAGKPRFKLKSRQIDFKIGSQGKIESPLSEYSTFLKTDPNARMTGKLREWFVSTVERISRKQDLVSFNFDKAMRIAFKGLNKQSADKVDEVLRQGSKDGKAYTFEELTGSGIGSNSLRLTEAEARSYYGFRNVVSLMYDLKNKQITDSYLATGIKLVDGVDGVVPARVYDDAEKALKNWKDAQSDSLWINVADDGLKSGDVPITLLKMDSKASLNKEMLEELYAKGYVLARNQTSSNFFTRNGFKTQWALIRPETALSPRGQQVLNKLPGYMPKQRSNGYFFVKRNRSGVLSGAPKDFKVGETVAWSDSNRAVEKWIAQQDDPAKFSIAFDREMSAAQASGEIAATHGGLYSGARKSTELPYVGENVAEFANSFESIQRYINHIGRQYPASLYRLGIEQKLLEVAKSLGVVGARGAYDVLEAAVNSGFKAPTAGLPATGSKEWKLLNDLKSQINFINMIPTDAELSIAKGLEQLGKKLEGPISSKIPLWNKVPTVLYNQASKSVHPADIIRGITFNHLLGLYNPAQILVQASGAAVAFAVAPLQFAKAAPKALVGWNMLDNLASDPATLGRVLKWMEKKGMTEFSEDYALWNKSGYRESVVNGNADYTSVFMRNMPYDEGIVRAAVRNHTVFYKMGELANTRMAFATAIERYKKAHNVTKINPNDRNAMNSIVKDTEILRLNMSRANQSDLNKGLKSVPLQFQQVITKYFEKILPKKFGGTDELTTAEKFRLTAIPTAIVGVGGVPLAQSVAIQIMSTFGIDETELSPEETQALKFGTLGWMLQEALEVNVDLSSRMTLGADVIKNIYESIVQQRAVWQWMGASGSVTERYYRNGQYLSEAFDLSVSRQDEINLDNLKFMASVLKEIAVDIPTLSRNYKQYVGYFFTQNPQFIKDGQYLFDLETMNDRTALFAIAGFQPQEISEMYDIDKEIKDGKDALNKFGDTDVSVIRRILSTHVLNDSSPVEHQALGALMVNSILTKYGTIEAAEIMKGVFDKSVTKRFDQNDLLHKFLLESEKRMQTGLNTLNTMISRKLEEQREGQ